MLGQARLQVGCFVLVDDVALGKFVKHGTHQWQHGRCFFGVRGSAELADSVASRLVLVTVAVALFLVGADALEGGFVMCHKCTLLKTGVQI